MFKFIDTTNQSRYRFNKHLLHPRRVPSHRAIVKPTVVQHIADSFPTQDLLLVDENRLINERMIQDEQTKQYIEEQNIQLIIRDKEIEHKLEQERLDKLEQERLEQERLDKLEQERLEQERLDKLEQERLEQERLEQERIEQEKKDELLRKIKRSPFAALYLKNM